MLPKFKNTAACSGTDTELWFSDGSEYSNESLLKRICASCPARQECLDYALEYKVLGWWGGTNAAQRVKLRKTFGIKGKPVLDAWEFYGA